MNADRPMWEKKIEALEQALREKSTALETAERALSEQQRIQQDTEAKLAETISIYRKTFDLAAIGIAHVTLDGYWLRVNQFLCDMLGYSMEELQRLRFQDVTHPDDLAKELAMLEDLIAGKFPSWSLEKRYINKQGQTVWGLLSVSLMHDEAGAPKYFISIIKNINQRVLGNIELEKSRMRLKAVLDNLSEGVIVFSHDGNVLEVNPAAMELFGYSTPEEISSVPAHLQDAFDVRTPEGEPVPAEKWPVSHLMKGIPVSGVELIVRRHHGGKAWIACLSGHIVQDSGNQGPLAVLTVEDITERRMAEVALRVSEERLRLAFDNIPDIVVIYNPQLRIQYINLAATQHVGKNVDELIGRLDTDLAPDSVFFLWRPLLQAALSSGAVQTGDFDCPAETGLRNFAVTCVPIMEPNGSVRELMAICHDYTERRQAEERARQAALHDPLTGLPNRTLMFEYARHIFSAARRAREKVSVVFMDLDRFKPINDIHGHEVGDAVLRQASNRIRERMRGEDMVFRLGGDEFLALVSHRDDPEIAAKVARHVMEAIGSPYHVGALELSLSCSIGISVFPDDATDIDSLISHADAAMYHAKQMGRNTFQFYTAALAERVHMQSLVEQGIRSALSRHQFRLTFQPLIDMRTGKVVSVEALLRWPGNGMRPDAFIQVAEATGLIGRLGEWVLLQACMQHALWKKEGLPAIPVAINVSPIQFRNKDFSHLLEEEIKRQRIDPAAIQIELTETAVMEDIDHAIVVLNHFQKRGIKISLDDFGTGYSSLNYLSRLPLNKIKIDKSFVHRLENDTASRAIIEAIIALGSTLNLEIVAEGIESESVLQYLRSHGCHQAQGFFLCKPIPGDEFASWYTKRMTQQAATGLH